MASESTPPHTYTVHRHISRLNIYRHKIKQKLDIRGREVIEEGIQCQSPVSCSSPTHTYMYLHTCVLTHKNWAKLRKSAEWIAKVKAILDEDMSHTPDTHPNYSLKIWHEPVCHHPAEVGLGWGEALRFFLVDTHCGTASHPIWLF